MTRPLPLSLVALGIFSSTLFTVAARGVATTPSPAEASAMYGPDALHPSAQLRTDREVTIPSGTVLRLRLDQAVGSDLSRLEDPVRARLASPVILGGRTVLPAESRVVGTVVGAKRSAKVKGRARLAMRFHSLTPAGADERYRITTATWARQAPGTKKKDALTIGVPAAGGALIGGLAGGKKGAGVGALVGGGAGTGVVLATRGKEVRLGRGAIVAVRLARPLTLRVDGER
jgi:hypothetical protein